MRVITKPAPGSDLVLIILAIATAAAFGVLVSSTPVSSVIISLVIISLAIIISLGISIRRTHRLIADPLYVSILSFLMFFVIRPTYDYFSGEFVWVYIDVSAAMPKAMIAVASAVVCFFIGNLIPVGRYIANSYKAPPKELHSASALLCANGLLAIAVLLRLIAVLLGGGLDTLFVRRELIDAAGSNVAFISEGFMVAVPAFLLYCYLIPKLGTSAAVGAAGSALLVLQSGFVGNRRYVLVLFAAAATLLMLRREFKPRLIPTVIGALVVFVGFIAPVELTRGGERSYIDSLELIVSHPDQVVEELLFVSQSTSMVNAFAIVVDKMDRGDLLSYRYGVSTVAETILQPIPRQLWPGKPEPIRTVVTEDEWGMVRGGCLNLCPTFSALATFYSDFGVIGVALGSFIIGIIFRIPSEYLRRFPSNFIPQAIFSVLVLTPLFVWWGSLSTLVVSVGTGVIPLIVVANVAGTRTNSNPFPHGRSLADASLRSFGTPRGTR